MKKEIKYSHIDYILVRTEVYEPFRHDFDTFLYSFGTLKNARDYAKIDIYNTMNGLGVPYSDDNDTSVSYEKYCGNDYWCYESDDICISWEIRKIHHRTTSEWEDPIRRVRWIEDRERKIDNEG